MADQILPSPEILRELLNYEPSTGKLYWKPRPVDMFRREMDFKTWNTRFANKEAFTAKRKDGYLKGTLLGSVYYAHRVAWAVHYGEWPEDLIDHINMNTSDNRIDNLRASSHSENMRNTRRLSSNTSGVKGVSWCKKHSCWVANIKLDQSQIHVGYFEELSDAISARRMAAEKHHGEFARHE